MKEMLNKGSRVTIAFMPDAPTISKNLTLTETLTDCIKVTFYAKGSNPLLPISAADDRGMFYGLDFANIRPYLAEIIHSNRGVIRGNHIHMHCTEALSVLSGEVDIYLLCNCTKKHLFKKRMSEGMTASIGHGIAHAMYTITENESTAVFSDGDPRDDRERVMLISL